jgi:hypothetical protein
MDASVCQDVAVATRVLVQKVKEAEGFQQLATPGEVCQVCDLRPWCEPFWRWQDREMTSTQALASADLGFEGTIREIELTGYHWILTVRWREAEVKIVASQERLPHLKRSVPGMGIRCLDMKLRGLRAKPRASVSEYSEIFLLM